jgi:nitrate/nitrite transporter NarK
MDLFAKILILFIFVCVWFIFATVFTLMNKKMNSTIQKEYELSKSKDLYLIKLGLEGPFVLLRLLKKK